MTQYLEKKKPGLLQPGNGRSMMRFGVLVAIVLGAIVILVGTGGFIAQYPNSVLMVGGGEALIALALGAKAWQRASE